ncbi:MAG: DUF2905 domain-containing protein [Bacteroidales bacterium]|nr:DUF2905 domain-containing protein [Bacteroidales bacterium]
MDQNTAKWIIIAGSVLVLVGVVIYFFHDKLYWMGRLPGDIRIEKEHFSFYFPIATMILVSILLSILIWLIRKVF